MDHKPLILVLGTGNSCRSQMAEGILHKYFGNDFEIASAGIEPKSEVHPLAVEVMSELGIDISGQRPKSLTQFLGKRLVQHLVVACDKANRNCPHIWPGIASRTYLPFDNPAQFMGNAPERLEAFRHLRDQIHDAIIHWHPAEKHTGQAESPLQEVFR